MSRRRWILVIGGLVVLAVLIVLLMPWLRLRAERPGTWYRRLPPSVQRHFFGTDSSGNDVSGLSTLRHLASVEAQCRTSGIIDLDHDGIGEYGTLAELAGAGGLRLDPRAETRGPLLRPALLAPAMAGSVRFPGVAMKSGYLFRVYLPGADGKPVHEGAPRVPFSGAVDTNAAEIRWWAYAWPQVWGTTGEWVVFVDSSGNVLVCSNETARWSGIAHAPPEEPVPGNGLKHGGETWRLVE